MGGPRMNVKQPPNGGLSNVGAPIPGWGKDRKWSRERKQK